MDRDRFIAVLHPSAQTGKVLLPVFSDSLPLHYKTEQIFDLVDIHSPKFSIVIIFQPEKFYSNSAKNGLEATLLNSKKGVILLTANKLNFIQRLPNLIVLAEDVSVNVLIETILNMDQKKNRFLRFLFRPIQNKTIKTFQI